MHCVLKEWSGVFESPQNNTNRFGFAGASALIFKTTTKSTLYTFYSKFHELLVAKVRLFERNNERESEFRFSLHFILWISCMNMEEQKQKHRSRKRVLILLYVLHNFIDVRMLNGLYLFCIRTKKRSIQVRSFQTVGKSVLFSRCHLISLNQVEINGNLSAPSINDEKPYQIIYGYPHKPTTVGYIFFFIINHVFTSCFS